MRQEVLMQELGVDEVYIDRLSGKNTDRPELKKMMDYVRKGDTVIVESISRFARNTRDLLELIEKLSEKGVEFVSRKEAIDTRNEADSMVFQTEKAMEEVGDKLDSNDKTAVEADLNALKSLIASTNPEDMTDSQVAEIKAAKEKLMESAQKLFAKVYEQAQGAQQAGQAGPGPDMNAVAGTDNSDDVVDGDYKEV